MNHSRILARDALKGKAGNGNSQETVATRHEFLYRRISRNGLGLVSLEPVSVSPEGKDYRKQLCAHLPESTSELAKVVEVMHRKDRLACVHVSHAVRCPVPKQWGCWLSRNC